MQTPINTKPSRIDPTLTITHDTWVVSLLRRKKSANPRHTFLMVEGLVPPFNAGMLYRFELVLHDKDPTKGSVKDRSLRGIPYADIDEMVEDFASLAGNGDKLYSRSWPLRKEQVYQLKRDVEADCQKTILYSEPGNKSISSSSHNCFTWAREKLDNLQDPGIQVPVKLTDYIAADPNLYLEATSGGNCLVM